MIRKTLIITIFLCICPGLLKRLYAFGHEITHPALTEKALEASNSAAKLDDYLKNQLGFSNGIATELEWVFPWNIKKRIKKGGGDQGKTTRTILEWINVGSNIEDQTLLQARMRHHFHAPIENPGLKNPNPNAGLDNRTDHPDWRGAPTTWPSPFDLTGQSGQVWAIKGTAAKDPRYSGHSWKIARNRFYEALTQSDQSEREEWLAKTFLDLGHVLHMIEDMGVPAHTRNDFLFAHYRTATDKGNPLETWVERKIAKNIKDKKDNILEGLLPAGWTPDAKAFNKVSNYYDADLYAGVYLEGQSPLATWGLSECSNYQFLSDSTVFGTTLSKFKFPHPAKENMAKNPLVEGGYTYFDGTPGYGVEHMAQKSLTEHYLTETGFGHKLGTSIRNTNTTNDKKVHEDYAKITIPRTIDYATGLINYFFRGRLSVEADEDSCDCDGKVEILITNNSVNSDLDQTLKGGTFELYWDDPTGNRTEITPLTVFSSETAGPTWNSSTTTLDKGSSVRARFAVPDVGNLDSYILVYKGNICKDPAEADPDDTSAIAVSGPFRITECPLGYHCECFPWGETPSQYDLTFSGVTLCPGRSWLGVDINGTWRLTQRLSSLNGYCFWRGGMAYMTVRSVGTSISVYSFGGSPHFFALYRDDCQTSGTGNNRYTVDDCSYWTIWSYGGSVTWARVGCDCCD